MWVVELRGQPDLTKEPVRRDADQELRVQNLERDSAPGRISGEKDPGVAAPADLPLDVVPPEECLAHQCYRIAPNDRNLVGGPLNGCVRGQTAQAGSSPP